MSLIRTRAGRQVPVLTPHEDDPRRGEPLLRDALIVSAALQLDLMPIFLGNLLHSRSEPLLSGLWLLGILLLNATLLFLLRRTLWAFVFAFVLSVTVLAFVGRSTYSTLPAALYVGARRWSSREANVALAICMIPIAYRFLRFVDPYPALAGIALTFAAWGWGRFDCMARLRLIEAERLHAVLSARAVQAERLRLAREIHDSVGHALSAMILQAAGVRTLVRSEDRQIQESLTMIQETGVNAMRDVHAMLGLLRAEEPPGDHDRKVGRLADLPTLYDVARASGLNVVEEVTGLPGELAESVELAAYRVVQECLTNTRKHAGSGAQVRVVQSWKRDRLSLTVGNSRALRPARGSLQLDLAGLSSGTGLAGLAERLALVGGRLEYGPTQGGGFVVRADMPTRSAQGGGSAL